MRIAVLGTGNVGSHLGPALANAGHEVVYGSRTPHGDDVLSHSDAARDADVIITAIHGQTVIPTLEQIGEDVLADKVVLDVSNALNPDFTLAYPNDSLGRQVQDRFPAARVVKSLNSMNVSVMLAPAGTVFVSGNDADAKNTVKVLLTDLGWADDSIMDLGGIATAIGPEHFATLFGAIFATLQAPNFNVAVVRSPGGQ